MEHNERQIIDGLFDKLRQAEMQSGPRDPEAESHIRAHVTRQPAAPYLMAQTIVMQEQALAAMQARNEELERQLQERPAASSGGLFGGLFGGSKPAPQPQSSGYGQPAMRQGGPWGNQQAPGYGDPRVGAYANPQYRHGGGGGFMAGAMQTAMGVAGGMLLGNALMGAFSGDEAQAAEAPAEPAAEADQASWDQGGGEDFGGDFGDEI
ncbi:DUF2076 domain-containing protein [Azospirillum sp. SYSU D00513]|uniref:DUF2076 domain-containing protein n=1 Tax=Azospirillum sp. SYSU D00513 TaxID=2812561 RepID=UPI001A95C945|nr:DUF2076 domain-containing protein [Azospirillum sp. SYSU D00513]